MANTFRIGTLSLSGKLVVPSDIGILYHGETPEILNTAKGKDLHWVVVDGKLISEKCLLRRISYHDIDVLGLADPSKIQIDGEEYILRLLKVGKCKDEPNEWDSAIDATGVNNAIWHWNGTYTWGCDTMQNPGVKPIRGGEEPRAWSQNSVQNYNSTGWRPVLEPVSVKLSQRICGKNVAVWRGQQILYGKLVSYTDYDLYLREARPLFSSGFDRTPWYADLGENCLVVDRKQIAAIQLR